MTLLSALAPQGIPLTRTLTATSPLTIGGGASADLSADRTIAIPAATASVPGHMTAAQAAKLDGIEAGATAGGGVTIATDVLSADITLAADSPTYQMLDPNGNNRIVNLPGTPASDVRFLISNVAASTSAYYLEVKVTGDSEYFQRLYPGSTPLEVAYDTTSAKWYSPTLSVVRTNGSSYTNGKYNTNVGYLSKGSAYGTAVGYNTDGTNSGAALGLNSNGSTSGAALGYAANGSSYGAAVGYSADANSYGAAIGHAAIASASGASLGYNSVGNNCGVAIGRDSIGNSYSAALGYLASTNGNFASVALGAYSWVDRVSEVAHCIKASAAANAFNKGKLSLPGWFGETTTQTASQEIFSGGLSSTRHVLRTSSAIAFDLLVVAKDNANNLAKAWKLTGLIRNSSDGTCELVGAVTKTVIAADTGVDTWDVAATADNANDALVIHVTPDTGANKTIRWVVTGTCAEVCF